MFAALTLGSLLAVVPSPAPAPTPTLPPVIIRTITTARCTTLHEMMRPIGYVTRRNDDAFRAMAFATQKFLSNFIPGDVPTIADLQASLGTNNGQGTGLNGTGTPMSASLSSTRGNDPLVYGPSQVLSAARIDAVAQQIFGNIMVERSYLTKSYKKFPEGKNPKVDAMRRAAQNVMTLQEALANKYEQFAGTYFDGMDLSRMTANNNADVATIKIALRQLLLGDTRGLAGDTQRKLSPNHPFFGYKSAGDLAQNGNPGEVLTALKGQEFAFTSTMIHTYNVCHQSHYILAPIHTMPAPSPKP
ncbi:MAG: hypothetical protein PXZ07_06285 [Candidatus Eremiobacteraeota bacterium]|nr:hypothetical protein [Candidatus Eremiobacteraeota bacterium]